MLFQQTLHRQIVLLERGEEDNLAVRTDRVEGSGQQLGLGIIKCFSRGGIGGSGGADCRETDDSQHRYDQTHRLPELPQ